MTLNYRISLVALQLGIFIALASGVNAQTIRF